MTTAYDVARLRLVAQRLAGPREVTPAAAVRWCAALQAQDYPGVLTSVGLRTAERRRASVIAALDAGEVVRSWPMRGTLHLTVADDLPWLLHLLAARVVRATTARRAGLGLGATELERAREVAVRSLSGGRRLRRTELVSAWRAAGLPVEGQGGVHILQYLALTGTLVLGPTSGDEQVLVLLGEWVPRPRLLERDEALGELAERFFRSHGPATRADLVRWAGLTVADARTGIDLARPSLVAVDVAGVEHLLDPQTPDRLLASRGDVDGVLLLPGFDELLLGYADRSAQLDPAYADRIVPGGNGMYRPTVVQGGRVVGTWVRTGSGSRRTLSATPFTAFPPGVEARLPQLYADLP